MAYRNDRDDFREPRRARTRNDGELGGDYARDDWDHNFGGDYARDDDRRGLSGDYARDPRWGGTGAAGDYFGSNNAGRGSSYVGYGPAQSRGTYGGDYRGFGAADAVYGGSTGPANFGQSTEFGGPRNPADWQSGNLGGSAEAFAGEDRTRSYRGRGPKNYKRSDARIAEEINERLTDDHYVDATDIDVSVSDGEVTLEGSVATRSMKRRAEDIAMSCGGVRDVQNRLRVNHTWEDVKLGKASE